MFTLSPFTFVERMFIVFILCVTGQYGMPRRWYFFVTKSYWCGLKEEEDGSPDRTYEMEQNAPQSMYIVENI